MDQGREEYDDDTQTLCIAQKRSFGSETGWKRGSDWRRMELCNIYILIEQCQTAINQWAGNSRWKPACTRDAIGPNADRM